MGRMMLIARREYLAYAKTFGFWLSLLSLPLFGAIGGGVVYLMKNAEPERVVAIVEAPGADLGLRDALQTSLDQRSQRLAQQAAEAAEKAGVPLTGATAAAAPKQPIRLVDAPSDIANAPDGEAQIAATRRWLGDDVPEDQRLDAVIFAEQTEMGPSARAWTRRTGDDTVVDAVRSGLASVNRRLTFSANGVDAAIVERTEAFRPNVVSFSPKSQGADGEVKLRDRLPMVIGFVSGFMLWSLIITGASILLNSVMEEKSNKILEVLLSSASATEVLAGKVLGVALVTLTMLAGWALLGAGGLIAFGKSEIGADILSALMQGGLIFYFILYMIGGYLMYAVLFAAIGAFCETPRDAQTLMGPIMMVLMVPLITMQLALRTPDSPVVQMLSWIPPFTPFLMSARAPSEPPLIEIIATMVGMFVFAALMVWLAGRAFRAGALTDVKLSWKSFGSAIRGAGH